MSADNNINLPNYYSPPKEVFNKYSEVQEIQTNTILDSIQNEYNIGVSVDGGQNSKIFRGINKSTNQKVIIKIVEPSKYSKPAVKKSFEIAKYLEKTGVVPKYFKMYETVDNIAFIIEDLEGYDNLNRFRLANYIIKLDIVKSLIEALKIFHSYRIDHGDINFDNIMYNSTIKKLVLIDLDNSCYITDCKCISKINPNINETYLSPELREIYYYRKSLKNLDRCQLTLWHTILVVGGLVYGLDIFNEKCDKISIDLFIRKKDKSVIVKDEYYLELYDILQKLLNASTIMDVTVSPLVGAGKNYYHKYMKYKSKYLDLKKYK